MGDSRRPFYFLVVSAVLNTGLDLLFVIRFHMGVAGVAWATIIAQAVSAVLVLAVLMRTDSCVRVELRRLRVHWDMLKKIVGWASRRLCKWPLPPFPTCSSSPISTISARTACPLDGVYQDRPADVPAHAVLALSATTFVGQNLGAGDTPVPSRASAGRWGSPWR